MYDKDHTNRLQLYSNWIYDLVVVRFELLFLLKFELR